MNDMILISNEMDAVGFLNSYLNDPEFLSSRRVMVKGWDSFNIHLAGEKFHNSITPSVMKGIIELQQALYEAFALAVYNENNINKLTEEQKKQLEIQVVVSEGSTNLDIDVNQIFGAFLAATVDKMDGSQSFVLFLTFIIVFFGHSFWKSWLENKTSIKEKELDNKIQEKTIDAMSEMNKKVVETLEKLATKDEKVAEVIKNSDSTRAKLVRSTRYADEVNIDGLTTMSGEDAEYLTRQPREEWEPIRLDGRYRLLQVNSSSTLSRKVKIRNLDTHRELTALLEDHTLDKKHLDKLGKAEWNHHPAYLEVKAKMKGDLIKDAVILSVTKVEEDIVFDDSKDLDED